MREITTPPAAVASAEVDLAALASKINSEHEAAEASARKGLDHYRRCGEALVRAKATVGHGGWAAWLKANVRFGERQARRCMEFARSDVTSDSPLEEQWALWQRISGNAPAAAGEDGKDEAPVPHQPAQLPHANGHDDQGDGQAGRERPRPTATAPKTPPPAGQEPAPARQPAVGEADNQPRASGVPAPPSPPTAGQQAPAPAPGYHPAGSSRFGAAQAVLCDLPRAGRD